MSKEMTLEQVTDAIDKIERCFKEGTFKDYEKITQKMNLDFLKRKRLELVNSDDSIPFSEKLQMLGLWT